MTQSRIYFKKASKYDIKIEHTANGGCIVKIGCCITAFSTPEEMLANLTEYYEKPEEMEKNYNKYVGPERIEEVATPNVGHGLVSSLSPNPDPADPDCGRRAPRIHGD